QTGAQNVTVQLSDSQGAYDEQHFVIQVANVNQPPAIVSQPVTRATELQAYDYQVKAIDPDLGDTLTYALTAAPQGMEIDSQSGEVNWTPATGQAGPHVVEITVTDSAGASDSQQFNITTAEQNY